MGMFQDALAAMRGEDGTLTIGEDFEGTLTSAYDADMTGPTAAVEEAQKVIADLQLQLQAAQAANWLLVQDGYGLDGSQPGEGDTESDPDNAQTETDDDDEMTGDDDDFLGDDDKDND